MIAPGPRLFCWRRRRLAERCRPSPLQDYLRVPMPDSHRDCRLISFLALDFETTGLDANKDQILSMGWVTMEGLDIQLHTARHLGVKATQAIPEASAVIHRITDDQAAQGLELAEALGTLLHALQGRVLLAHHAGIELGFLERACRQVYGQGCLVPAVDTLQLAHAELSRRQEPLRQDSLRLGNLRQRYNLPVYRGHDALNDALAAAELFAAQVEHRSQRTVPLVEVLHRPGAWW